MFKKITIAPNIQTSEATKYAGVDELWANERYLINYNRDIVNYLSEGLGSPKTVLEFGAGIGTLANLWASITGVKPECVEIDSELTGILEERKFIVHKNLKNITNKFDGIYSSNVIEHIDDDLAALKEIYEALNRDGCVAIYVPAFMCLYSELDAYVGHYRRYNKKELIKKMTQAGFKVIQCHYVDSLGFFAWFLMKIRGYNNKLSDGRDLKTYDKFIYPLSRFLDKIGFKFLFGKNILIIAKKES